MAALKGFLRKFRDRTGTRLGIVILAALLLEGFAVLGYYQARKLLRHEMEVKADNQLRLSGVFIENSLASAELTVREHLWDLETHLDNPDLMFDATRRLMENNPLIVGACVSYAPGYFPSKGRLFQPYATRSGTDVLVIDLAETGHDYTVNPSFQRPLRDGTDEWSNPYQYGADSLANLITYAYPLRDRTGQVVAVCGLDIDLSSFGDTLNLHPYYPSSFLLALTKEGRLVAGPSLQHRMRADVDRVVALVNNPAVRRTRVQGFDSIAFRVRNEGKDANIHILSLPSAPFWQIVAVNYDDEVYAPARKLRLFNAMLLLASLLVLLFILFRYIRNEKRLSEARVKEARLGSELHIARKIQMEMLPKAYPPFPDRTDVDVYGSLEPAREVGGDLYDYFIRDGKLFFVIGDVSGKGVPSAMVMAMVQSLFRMVASRLDDPAHILTTMNEAGCQRNETTMFVTLFLGVLDLPSGRLQYCNAGHDRPVLLGKTAEILKAESNLPVGVFPDTRYVTEESQLPAGTTIFLYTDGLTEAKNEQRELFSRQRVLDVLARNAGKKDCRRLLEAMGKAAHGFMGQAQQSDDLTMLAIHYTPGRKQMGTDEETE
jgi:sigma-B regulation protein RsbU (phosphoserine phosphatase)